MEHHHHYLSGPDKTTTLLYFMAGNRALFFADAAGACVCKVWNFLAETSVAQIDTMGSGGGKERICMELLCFFFFPFLEREKYFSILKVKSQNFISECRAVCKCVCIYFFFFFNWDSISFFWGVHVLVVCRRAFCGVPGNVEECFVCAAGWA